MLQQNFPPDSSKTARLARQMTAAALETGHVALAFQPVVQAGQPDRPAFHEGLIRLLDPVGNIIPAARFMPHIDGGDLALAIDCTALRLGLRELAEVSELRLAINVSPHSVAEAAWIDVLNEGLAHCPTIAERLVLEITENARLYRMSQLSEVMRIYQARGICFALDDFGAGCTSFATFKDFRFDICKVDGRFSRGIDTCRDNQVLMDCLVSLSRHFEMLTVAEAVETSEEAAFLADLGVDCLQGYHFARPSIQPLWRETLDFKVA